MGVNDGLVSTASLMLGVGAGSDALRAMQLAGVAGLFAGALSMACGEYISVSSQRDAEEADVEKVIPFTAQPGCRGRGKHASTTPHRTLCFWPQPHHHRLPARVSLRASPFPAAARRSARSSSRARTRGCGSLRSSSASTARAA